MVCSLAIFKDVEALEGNANHSLKDSLNLQRDYKSVLARQVISKLSRISEYDQNLLDDWDFDLSPDSSSAALWAVWYYKHLIPNIKVLIDPIFRDRGFSEIDSLTVLDLLDTERGKTIAYETLSPAISELKELLMRIQQRNWEICIK